MPKSKEKTVKKDVKKKKVEEPKVQDEVYKDPVVSRVVEKSLPEEFTEKKQVVEKSTYFVPLEPVRVETKRSFMWWGIFFIAAMVGFGASLFFYYKMFQKSSSNSLTQIPTPTTMVEPTSVNLSSHTIQILNGSGIKGEAAKVKSLLEESGFKVSEVGNADTSEYKETVVQKKETVDDVYIDKLEEELAKTYVVQISSESAEKEDTDVVVIVGSEKREN